MDSLLGDLIQTLGVPAAMLLLMWWALATGRLVTRREHDAVFRNEQFWRRIALRSLEAAEVILVDADVGTEDGEADD
jgi:hypothetical protein